MRKTILFLMIVLSGYAYAKPKQSAAISAKHNTCKEKVTALIKSTARAMGLKQDFGIPQIEGDADGQDGFGNPLTTFDSGIFIIDEGYLSNSGATVTVRKSESANCEVLSLDVSIGG